MLNLKQIIQYKHSLKMMQSKQNSMSRVSTVPIIDDKNLEEAIQLLFSHQKTCEKTGKYMEAEAVKKRLAKIKIDLQKKRRIELVTRFEEQRRQVEEAHLQEMGSFNIYWDNKFVEYQGQAQKIEQDTLQKHQAEEEEFITVIEQSIPSAKRQTSQIINLRKIEEQLARRQEYVSAHKIQREITEIQRKENQKWNYMRTHKIKNLIVQLKSKQEVQLSALLQKIAQGFEQQKKLRKFQEQKLIQKYSNFIKQLETKHNQEMIKFEKHSKLQSNINFSRSQMTSRVLKDKN